jgi:hypothetical protein
MEKRTKAAVDREVRETFMTKIDEIDVEGFDYMGRIVEGEVFQREDGKVVVVKTIVKADTFDLDDALQEYEDREAARAERETEQAIKRVKREAEKALKEAAKAEAKAMKERKAAKAAEGTEDTEREVDTQELVIEEIVEFDVEVVEDGAEI